MTFLPLTYYGSSDPTLYGKRALARPATQGWVFAQFDDTSSGYGFGWKLFPAEDFK